MEQHSCLCLASMVEYVLTDLKPRLAGRVAFANPLLYNGLHAT
jgi:hypothetical protein